MNKLPWFKHDGQASDDGWLRKVVRAQGIGAGWIWWGLCEQLHTHGKGNVFRRDIKDMLAYSCTSKRVLFRTLGQLAEEYQGIVRLSFKHCGDELEVEIKNFRKKQEKDGLKTPAKPPQKTTDKIREEEKRVEKKNVSGPDRPDAPKDESGEPSPAAVKPSQEDAGTETTGTPAEGLPGPEKLCRFLRNLILDNDPKARVPKLLSKTMFGWIRDADFLLRKDGRPIDEAVHIMRWALDSEFWKPNILSMGKFREKYTQLLLQSDRDRDRRDAAVPRCEVCEVRKPKIGHPACGDCSRCSKCGGGKRLTIRTNPNGTKRVECKGECPKTMKSAAGVCSRCKGKKEIGGVSGGYTVKCTECGGTGKEKPRPRKPASPIGAKP